MYFQSLGGMGTSNPLASKIPFSGTFGLGGFSVGFPWDENTPYGNIPSYGLGSSSLSNLTTINTLLGIQPLRGMGGNYG